MSELTTGQNWDTVNYLVHGCVADVCKLHRKSGKDDDLNANVQAIVYELREICKKANVDFDTLVQEMQ